MFDLNLTPEQIEFRDTVRDFVRDAMVWTHLAGDTVQRVKILKRLGAGSGPAAPKSVGAH